MNATSKFSMKPIPLSLLAALLLSIAPAGWTQESHPLLRPGPVAGPGIPPQPTKFDLDFKGGTLEQLIAAIEQATGKELNVIVPPEAKDALVQPFKLRDVTVPFLFQALRTSIHSANDPNVAYFAFAPQGEKDNDNTIWTVQKVVRPSPSQNATSQPTESKRCDFYHLGPYLKHYKVEDITTALDTAWKMLGVTNVPEMKFHKDTQLLIAVGTQDQLDVISGLLSALDRGTASAAKTPAVKF